MAPSRAVASRSTLALAATAQRIMSCRRVEIVEHATNWYEKRTLAAYQFGGAVFSRPEEKCHRNINIRHRRRNRGYSRRGGAASIGAI